MLPSLSQRRQKVNEEKQKNVFTGYAGVLEEERGFRYFEIWDENGQSAKFYIVEQYLELSQSMMEAIAESLAKGEGK